MQLKIAIPGNPASVVNYVAALTALGAEVTVVEQLCPAEPFDGLVMPGGIDVDPSSYHRENVACGRTDPALDALQLGMMDRFIKLGKPVFGICRGHQLVNVYFGGTLIQHIVSDIQHPCPSDSDKDPAHASTAEPGSFLADLYGTSFVVNSSHHQSSDEIGAGLHIVQRAPDGIVEGAYHETLPVWSVQWHPERMCFAFQRDDTVDGSKVLQFFLDRCKEQRERGGCVTGGRASF